MKHFILISLTTIILYSCSQYTCPSINGGKEPRDKTKKFTARQWIKQRSDGYYVVYTVHGFRKETSVAFECKPTDEQLDSLRNPI